MPGYRIVATGTKEFDYPKGNDNVYTSYAGPVRHSDGQSVAPGAVRLDQDGHQHSLDHLFEAGEPNPDVARRADAGFAGGAVPQLDRDPYPVLSEGRLYWIQDAYTTSDQFPYANPHQAGFARDTNYVRNSVKAVTNMYDGRCSSMSWIRRIRSSPLTDAPSRRLQATRSIDAGSEVAFTLPEDLFAIRRTSTRPFI